MKNTLKKAKYYLYRNLHSKTFSLQFKGLVIERPLFVIMEKVEFKVSVKGRQRVLEEKRKNVHAKVIAENYSIVEYIDVKDKKEIYYNPYLTPNFIDKETGKPIYFANKVYCVDGSKIFIDN